MKQTFFITLLLSSLIGGATWYGLNRGATPSTSHPDYTEKTTLAEKFVEMGQSDKALKVFDELELEGFELSEEHQILRIEALDQKGDYAEALKESKAFLESYPESSYKEAAEVISLTAELSTSGLSNPVLRKSVEEFLQRNPKHEKATELHAALARQEIELGDYTAAQRRLNGIMDQIKDSDQLLKLAQPLGESNLKKLYSSALGEGDIQYTVKSGDTVYEIAQAHEITSDMLMKCNNISDPTKLRVGQKLKIPNVNFSITVDVAANLLTLFNHGDIFKIYPVRTGRESGATPTGSFRILNKKKNPTWRPGNGHVYLPGDPNNELGTRWMAFEGDILGIHGTLHPETVGEYASNGCVGMLTEDVEELFNLIVTGTELTITGERDLERHRVIPAPEVPAPQQVAQN